MIGKASENMGSKLRQCNIILSLFLVVQPFLIYYSNFVVGDSPTTSNFIVLCLVSTQGLQFGDSL